LVLIEIHELMGQASQKWKLLGLFRIFLNLSIKLIKLIKIV